MIGWRAKERDEAAKLIEQHGDAAYEFCRQKCIEADRVRDGKALKHWTAVRVQVRRQLRRPDPARPEQFG